MRFDDAPCRIVDRSAKADANTLEISDGSLFLLKQTRHRGEYLPLDARTALREVDGQAFQGEQLAQAIAQAKLQLRSADFDAEIHAEDYTKPLRHASGNMPGCHDNDQCFAAQRNGIHTRHAMNAEIISIGSELTSGQNLDTNGQWLSQRLAELGIAVHFHTTVADNFDDNLQVFDIARQRASLVFSTGGLGPTQDDLTREVLAKLGGVELQLHEPSLQFIRQLFSDRNREMPERNRVQALFPVGSEPIPNDQGTAPGIWWQWGETIIIAMPGVPREMHHMYQTQVEPRLRSLFAGKSNVLVERRINCFGAGESQLEAKVFDLTRRGSVPEVGITASDAVISLRIMARAATVEEARQITAPIEATIRERLGEWVYGVDDEHLHHVVGRLLIERQKTVAIAESLTGGLVTSLLTEVSGISAALLGGCVAYANDVKESQLGVPAAMLAVHGAVSAPVAEAMAQGVRERHKADLGLSTTGIAGPTGATPTKPVGLVFIGLAWEGGVRNYQVNWFGSRQEIRTRSAKSALNALRLHLLQGS
jgi:nicotinamide-nucleotide amidase